MIFPLNWGIGCERRKAYPSGRLGAAPACCCQAIRRGPCTRVAGVWDRPIPGHSGQSSTNWFEFQDKTTGESASVKCSGTAGSGKGHSY